MKPIQRKALRKKLGIKAVDAASAINARPAYITHMERANQEAFVPLATREKYDAYLLKMKEAKKK